MPEPAITRAFADGLVAEFATAVEAVIGSPVAVTTTASGDGGGWLVQLAISGPLRGAIVVWAGEADVAALVKRVLGSDDPPDEASIVDLLREMWTQAASAIGLKDPFNGVKAVVSTPVAGIPAVECVSAYELGAGEGPPVRLAVSGEVTAATVAVAVVATPRPPPAAVAEPPAEANARLELVLDIDLPLVVRFGRTFMSIKALADLGPGSIVDMARSPDEPVEMLIGDRVIARGEVVVVGGNYGVRIMDLVSSVVRIRAVGR